jgi:hypothetical protein
MGFMHSGFLWNLCILDSHEIYACWIHEIKLILFFGLAPERIIRGQTEAAGEGRGVVQSPDRLTGGRRVDE